MENPLLYTLNFFFHFFDLLYPVIAFLSHPEAHLPLESRQLWHFKNTCALLRWVSAVLPCLYSSWSSSCFCCGCITPWSHGVKSSSPLPGTVAEFTSVAEYCQFIKGKGLLPQYCSCSSQRGTEKQVLQYSLQSVKLSCHAAWEQRSTVLKSKGP